MKRTTLARRLASLFMALCMLAAPLAVSAKKGEKNFKAGLNHEKMEQWEQAAQEFALAVATNPADMEYQLHYRRSLFNASQKFMDQGRALSEQGDYAGAYNAFRQAYGYDPVNELAVAEMNRVLRLQREKEGVNGTTTRSSTASAAGGGGATTVPASYDASGAAQGGRVAQQAAQALPPTRSEQLRVINFNGDLEDFIRKMADELGLNVIFDRDFPKRQVKVNLRDVTAARALDHIFIAQNLFFQKLDRRTVLVADQGKRGQYQQLVLRTFYLTNIDPQNARNLIQSALPPNAGRQPLVTPNKETNSITVRDTPENIRLIEELLRAIDKDRAEVVMDVNIYEVSRTNLIQFGNQIGSAGSLGSLGGFNPLSILVGGPNGRGGIVNSGGSDGKGGGTKTLADATATTLITALGGAFVLPATQLSMFQSKDNSRLLAHTQVHAFDGEQSVTRIGQKVPIQTAQVTPFGGLGGGTATPQAGGANSVFGSGGYPVIQYQDTGLNLKFTPQVFPNQDVEVKMEIESNDVIGGANALTPTFSQRTMSGKARIPNGRTVMIASVAQDKQSRGRQGLPLLGLIPVLGRLFSTPTDNSSNADIVITVSPRVLSAPVVTPDDIQTRDAGTLQAPISDSLEAVVKAAEREEQLAAARQLPTNTAVQVNFDTATGAKATETAANAQQPAAQTSQPNTQTNTTQIAEASSPAYVPAPQILAGAANSFAPTSTTNAATVAAVEGVKTAPGAHAIPVINTDDPPPPVPAVALKDAAAKTTSSAPSTTTETNAASQPQAGGAVMHLLTGGEMRVGERRRVMVLVNTTTPLSLAAAALKFDPRVLAVRSITKGSLFGDAQGEQPSITQSVDQRGSLLALVAPAPGSQMSGAGVLLFIEVEALAAGESLIGFDRAGLYLMSADGKAVVAQTSQARLTVK